MHPLDQVTMDGQKNWEKRVDKPHDVVDFHVTVKFLTCVICTHDRFPTL